MIFLEISLDESFGKVHIDYIETQTRTEKMTKIFPLAVAMIALTLAGPAAVDFVAAQIAPVTDGTVAAMQAVLK